MRYLILALAALTTSRAEADPDPLLLESPEQVEALCASSAPAERVRFRGDVMERGRARAAFEAARSAALERRYRMAISGRYLVFDPYDADQEELTVSSRTVLTGVRGALRLWAAEDGDLPVTVGPVEAQRLLEAHRSGTLALQLTFGLPGEEQGESPCVHVAGSRQYTLAVEPVSWVYSSRGMVLARGGEGADRPLAAVVRNAHPMVKVGEPEPGDEGLRRAVAARNRELVACYAAALARDASLDGTLVLELEPRREGSPSVRVAADSVQDDQLAGCVRGEVARANFPPGLPAATLPIRFVLEAPSPPERPPAVR